MFGNFLEKGGVSTVKATICEYNPFHKGHLISLEKMNLQNDDIVISLMSGNFVQRGEPAVFDKYTRAKAAILSGVDLVLELPYPYSCSSAQYFALGAVKILDGLRCVDELWFGSECGDIDLLSSVAENLLSEQFVSEFECQRDCYPSLSENAAKQKIYESLFGCGYPLSPNDILAVEYIKALIVTNSKIIPKTYKRESGFSASKSREAISNGDYSLIPQGLESLFLTSQKHSFSYCDRYILGEARKICSTDTKFNEFDSSLAHILSQNAKNSRSFDELLEKTVNKSYTSARVKRAVISHLTGCKKRDVRQKPKYTVVLASNKKGTALLGSIRNISKIKIVTKPSELKKLNADIEIKADEIYTLSAENTEYCGEYLKKTPYIEK